MPKAREFPSADLDDILKHTEGIWDGLKGARIFVTGGTGFIGRWILEAMARANSKHGLGLSLVVLTRSRSAFAKVAPGVAGTSFIEFLEGDIRTFPFPKGAFTHIIHAATAASAKMNLEEPLEMISTIVDGSRRLFEFAAISGAKTVLQTSTGGVYGRQPPSIELIPEDFMGGPDPMDPYAAYSEAKRLSEMIGRIASGKHGFDHKIARITALVGPGLPLDAHYAMGNFIRDALAGGPIRIRGSGRPERSYLYIADLVAWLLVILVKGESNRPYNSGSDKAISLLATAELVARIRGGNIEITVENKKMNDGRPDRYVLSTARAQTELGLRQWNDLETAVQKTLDWNRQL